MVAVEKRAGGAPIHIEISEIPEVGESNETGDIYGGKTRGAREKVIQLARPLFSEALDLIGSCAEEVHDRFSSLPPEKQPQELEMQFSVKLDAMVGAKIVETTAGAQFQVLLRWKAGSGARDEPQSSE
ncbi:CU044_2847 family protein [Streptomyces sp. NPDC049970]|uniref:CU044_2847 family protein n=1 Tax=Streptomyces sp. NPDC049970 TaxID=3155033 RepID=UPI003420572D